MRILVVGINFAPDLIGVAKYNTELCESLAGLGHSVRIITAPPYYPDWTVPEAYRGLWFRRELTSKTDVVRCPIYVPRRPSAIKRLLHHASFAIAATAPSLLSALAWRPDIVVAIAPSLLSAPLAAFAAKVSGAASWLHVQDLEVDAAFELGMLVNRNSLKATLLRFERAVLNSFDRVSTISGAMRSALQKKGINPEKLSEAHNWIDTAAIVPASRLTQYRRNLNIGSQDIVALYSGAMSNKQGLDLVVDAARRLRQGNPLLHFILCGNGPARDDLTDMAKGLDNVHFLDLQPVAKVGELLNTADIHLLPQKAQVSDLVLPSKLAGMLASGRPIIAMADPGTGIATEVDEAGVLVAPGNADGLAAALQSLAADEASRRQFGQMARQRAELYWDREHIIRALNDDFLSLVRGPRPTISQAKAPTDRPASTSFNKPDIVQNISAAPPQMTVSRPKVGAD